MVATRSAAGPATRTRSKTQEPGPARTLPPELLTRIIARLPSGAPPGGSSRAGRALQPGPLVRHLAAVASVCRTWRAAARDVGCLSFGAFEDRQFQQLARDSPAAAAHTLFRSLACRPGGAAAPLTALHFDGVSEDLVKAALREATETLRSLSLLDLEWPRGATGSQATGACHVVPPGLALEELCIGDWRGSLPAGELLRASGASLVALELRDITLHPDGAVLAELAAGAFPRLRHLAIANCSFFPGGPPTALNLPALQSLALDNTNVQGTPLLPVMGPIDLELQAPALTSLSMRQRNYGDIEFKVMLHGALPRLATTSFADIWRADQVLDILGGVPDEHILCVQEMELSCPAGRRCRQVAPLLRDLAASFPSLRTLRVHVAGRPPPTPLAWGVHDLLVRRALPQLRELVLDGPIGGSGGALVSHEIPGLPEVDVRIRTQLPSGGRASSSRARRRRPRA